MARTIQKRIKFSRGQIVPELVERTDLELYDASAQEMTNVVSSVYGGVRSRRGTKKIDRIFSGMTEQSGTATTSLGGTASYIQDKTNRYVSDAIGSNRNIFTIDYGEALSSGTLKVRGIKLDYRDPDIQAAVSSAKGSYRKKISGMTITEQYTYYYYSALTIVDAGVGITSQAKILKNPNNDWKKPADYGGKDTSNPSLSFTFDSKGSVATATVNNGGRNAYEVPKSNLIYQRVASPRQYNASVYYSSDGLEWVQIGTKTLSETSQDFDFAINESFRYIKFDIDPTEDSIGTTLSMQYASLMNGAFSKGVTKLVSYVYNNQDKYVLVLGSETISIYKDDELVGSIMATGLLSSYFDILKWTYNDDTIIFTHPEMKPKILKHLSDGTWTWGDLDIKNTPYTLFGSETVTAKTVGITPSAEEGAIKITADSSVFDSSYVGQYIDGNGGRVKVTEYISGTVVNGYTTIPFYTKDKITSWDYISGYEQVWSVTKGWPRTCLFAQQRLWFGGSKSKPSTVWASRLGDYFNFKNSGNYDNDSIDVDLLTNDVIVNMVDNRGIHIFTTGQEISSPDNSYTPDKISFITNTRNGSVANIIPVIVGGTVCFVEKNGKSLLSYVYNYDQASYLTNNLSLFSNLVEKPSVLTAEINSEKDRGDFIYLVLENGTMLVGCIALDQNITSLSKFKTNGEIKDVCSVGSETYLLVDRGNYYYLEKIEDVKTDITTDVSVNTTPQTDIYGWEHESDVVYTLSATPSVSDTVYDVYLKEVGTISAIADDTITVSGVDYEREETQDTKSIMYVDVLSDYNGRYVYLYDDNEVYEKQIVNDGKIILSKPLNKDCSVGIAFDYKIVGNPIAINHKTTSIKKRITTADVVCKDTPVLEFCGQKKNGKDNYKFFSCTKYGDDVRYTLSGEFYKMDVLSVQLNINYEG